MNRRAFSLQWVCYFWVLVVLFFKPVSAHSHALHPESIDRYAELTLTSSRLVVIYEVMLGINPTERATKRLDANNDGQITDEERTVFLKAVAQEYANGQIVRLGNKTVSLLYQFGDVYSTIGHNGINVLRLDLAYVGPLPADIPRETTIPFSYTDNNFNKFPGWKQMQLLTRDGVRFEGHIPYTEYKPFDYEILNKTGFFPTTESFAVSVFLPKENSSQDAPIRLPVKISLDDIMRQRVHRWEMVVLGGVAIFFAAAVIVLFLRYRR